MSVARPLPLLSPRRVAHPPTRVPGNHLATNKTRIVKKVVPTDSFFAFFSPPSPPSIEALEAGEIDEDELELLDERLEMDYQVGEDLKERVRTPTTSWPALASILSKALEADPPPFALARRRSSPRLSTSSPARRSSTRCVPPPLRLLRSLPSPPSRVPRLTSRVCCVLVGQGDDSDDEGDFDGEGEDFSVRSPPPPFFLLSRSPR